MIPVFKIIAENTDITDKIKKRLVSLSISDEAGMTSDTCTLTIDDRDNNISIPNKGAWLVVSIGYKESGLINKGKFLVDEVSLSGPPDKINITARGTNFSKDLKTSRNMSWHDTTLGNIVHIISVRAGLNPKIDPELADDIIIHEDQTDESDLNFLTRLAKERDAVIKPAGNYLLFIKKIKSETITGKQLPVKNIYKKDISSWDINLPNRKKYNTVIATWQDKENAELQEEKVGDGTEPIYRIKNPRNNKDEAFKAAKRLLERYLRRSGTLKITMPGNPELIAETPLNLIDFKKEINGLWIIKKITHSISSNYNISLECEPKEEK